MAGAPHPRRPGPPLRALRELRGQRAPGAGGARDPVRPQRGDPGRPDPRGHRARRGGVLPAQLPGRPHREQALEPVPPDDEGGERAAGAGQGRGLLPARPARQADGGGPPQAVRGALGRKVHLGGRRRGPEPAAGPAVRLRELRDGRARGGPEGRTEEAGEADRSRRGEAHQRAHPGHAPGEACRLLPQGPRREGSGVERPDRLRPDEVRHREAELRGQGSGPGAGGQDAGRRHHRGGGRAAEGAPAQRDRRHGRVRGPGREGPLHGRSVPEHRARTGPRALGARPRERRDHRHQPHGPARRRGAGDPRRRGLPLPPDHPRLPVRDLLPGRAHRFGEGEAARGRERARRSPGRPARAGRRPTRTRSGRARSSRTPAKPGAPSRSPRSRPSTPRTRPPTGRARRRGSSWSATRTSRRTSSSTSPATATSSSTRSRGSPRRRT